MCKQVINFDFFVNLVSHNQEPAVIVLDREEQLFPFCPTFFEVSFVHLSLKCCFALNYTDKNWWPKNLFLPPFLYNASSKFM